MSANAQRPTPDASALSQALGYVIGAERVAVLPSRKNPKLLVSLCDLKARWRLNAFYPAFSLRAKPWRLLQRTLGCFGWCWKTTGHNNEPFKQFVGDALPSITHTSVLLGTPGPNRKIIVQLWNKETLAGYLKVGVTDSAADKICAEAAVLEKLPDGLGPRLIRFGELDGKKAMILSLVEGQMLKASLPEWAGDGNSAVGVGNEFVRDIFEYLDALKVSERTCSVDEHPAIKRLRAQLETLRASVAQCPVPEPSQLEQWLAPLRGREWPVVIQHGDFAPWNVYHQKPSAQRSVPSSLCAIDWEEGRVEGFAYFDFIHFVGQTAALCQKLSPKQTMDYLMRALTPQIGEEAVLSIIKLGLLSSYVSLRESVGDEHWIQDWRRSMWEMAS
jgi:hypothetical protein